MCMALTSATPSATPLLVLLGDGVGDVDDLLALLRVEPVVVRVGLHSRPLPSQVRNVECGMSVRASNRGIALRHRPCNSAFRTPHSALGVMCRIVTRSPNP